MSSPVRVASVGCCHGALNEIYANIYKEMEAREWDNIDCVIIGGDFQALRNSNDATCISVPPKYKQIGDFHEYYSGQRIAPFLTIFCGGNHEAGNHLFELYYGGWVAPNIYYLGAANVLRLGPLRIAGMSGIWKGYDYRKTHFERIPYAYGDTQSIYHIRELDVRKLLQIRTQVDLGLSHDWPRAIEKLGDSQSLFRMKKFLQEDSIHGRLGSQAARNVLDRLRPAYWLSAHLHVKFALTMGHDGCRLRKVHPGNNKPVDWGYEAVEPNGENSIEDNTIDTPVTSLVTDVDTKMKNVDNEPIKNDDEINLDSSSESEHGSPVAKRVTLETKDDMFAPSSTPIIPDDIRSKLPASLSRPSWQTEQNLPTKPSIPEAIRNKVTKFMALDKPGGHGPYLDLIEVNAVSEQGEVALERPFRLQYDPEWLAITRVFAEDLKLGDRSAKVPDDLGQAAYLDSIIHAESWVKENIIEPGLLDVPINFTITAPVYDPSVPITTNEAPPEYNNPQTDEFCKLLGISNKFVLSDEERAARAEAHAQLPDEPERSYRGHGRGRGGRGRGSGRGNRGRSRY
ncbi:DBR1-domain-containing protein [Penicillium taxi]|uniref:DBR1-domain-containing protein n=1 Tax=Penicillium taxi TaxID=168475 RepID=UPI0025450D00|nr:DBR1-domain-containing protein [Penicillium taxi]KAJ5894904.1 DBR1-domain-containing protein [Penicillium taxi]